MTVLSVEHPTLLDISRGAAGSMSPRERMEHERTAELLMQSNGFIEKIAWKVGNDQDGHSFTVRKGLTTPTWRRLNYGVRPQKGTRDQLSVRAGHMVNYWEADRVTIETGNKEANLMNEMEAFHQGNAHELARAAIYGSESGRLDEFTGLARYYDSTTTEIGSQFVIDAGGTGDDLRSIYLVGSSPSTISMFVPAGRPMGFQMENPGGSPGSVFMSQTAPVLNSTANDGRMMVYGQYFYCWAGLVVEDARFGGRICNIDHTMITDTGFDAPGSTTRQGPILYKLMQNMLNRVHQRSDVNYFWIMPRGLVAALIAQQTSAISNSTLTKMDLGDNGVMTASFGGVPICIEDALDNMAESRVT